MSVSVLLSGTLKDGLVEQFKEICAGAFHVTRAFDGCQNINLTLNVEDPHKYVLTEVWDSKEHYEKYALKEVLELIDDFMRWHGTEKYKQSDMKYPLKDIVKTLET